MSSPSKPSDSDYGSDSDDESVLSLDNEPTSPKPRSSALIPKPNSAKARLAYLKSQGSIFSHFLKGDSAKSLPPPPPPSNPNITDSPRKAAHRKTEEAEDAELLAAAASTAATNRLDVQPSNLSPICKMHPYQLQGLNWMICLHDNGVNGVLADEMGLGKTLQTISLLAYLREACGCTGPHLIVVPKSVTGNWIREIAKWCPCITAVKLPGTREERRACVERMGERDKKGDYTWDVCVTSYEGVLKEKSFLKRIKWEYLIIDEAHRIKNENSSLSQVVRTMYTEHRLLITGTPLQNNLHELWALLNFLLPDVFGDSATFDSWFNMDDGDGKDNVIKKLHTILRPFMLRRIKKDVAHALPPKKETKLYIGLTEMQRDQYEKILKKESVELNALGGPQTTKLLNVLMQLRKVCNHPYLFQGAEPGPPYSDGPHLWENAGKMQLLHKLLVKLKKAESRVLIFSQMTRVLDILEDYCNYVGHKYCRIDGNTDGEARDEAMDVFNEEGSEKFVFLLSTRAGGLGINLATADIVILFDSDWNPQVDLQAMDRAHRIGQKKPVQVFRFMCEGTVEEKIAECADRKLFLDAAVIQQGRLAEQQKGLGKDQLMTMVSFGADQILSKKGGGYTDEDIDVLLQRGEDKTNELNAMLKTDAQHNLANFTLGGGGDEEENSMFKFGGADFKNGTAGPLLIDIGTRERKLTNTYTGKKNTGVVDEALAKKRKAVYQDFQFYDADRLEVLVEAEVGLAIELDRFMLGVKDLKTRADVASSQSNMRAELGMGESREELVAKAETLEAEGEAKYNVSKADKDERRRLEKEGFDWSKAEFRCFTGALERHGRYNLDEAIGEIVEDIGGRSVAEIKRYYVEFMYRYQSIEGWEKIFARFDRAEQKRYEEAGREAALDWKLQNVDSSKPIGSGCWEFFLIKGRGTNASSYSVKEDAFLLYCLGWHGYGMWEEIRVEIRKHWQWRFSMFFRMKTAQDLKNRCEYLIKLVINEHDEFKVEEQKKGPKKVKKENGGGANSTQTSPMKKKAEEAPLAATFAIPKKQRKE